MFANPLITESGNRDDSRTFVFPTVSPTRGKTAGSEIRPSPTHDDATTTTAVITSWRNHIHGHDTVLVVGKALTDNLENELNGGGKVIQVELVDLQQRSVYIPHGDVAIIDSSMFETNVLSNLLGRVRKFCVILNMHNKDDVKEKILLMLTPTSMQPSWRIHDKGIDAEGALMLKREFFVLTFAVTEGGRDGKHQKAVMVERTWGRRTPIVWYSDVHHAEVVPHIVTPPLYLKDKEKYLSFKMTAIWEHVYKHYFQSAVRTTTKVDTSFSWYIRLWDDNYFYEHNLYRVLRHIPLSFVEKRTAVGKVGFRYLAKHEQHYFFGGGAGWFLSQGGMEAFANNASRCDSVMKPYEHRRDIFLPHALHDEDILLSICMKRDGLEFYNIPGVEHVSPGMFAKQRCVPNDVLLNLHTDERYSIVYQYPLDHVDRTFDGKLIAHAKPIVWHYMTPRRLAVLESLLYPQRRNEFVPLPGLMARDVVKPGKKCYPGVPPVIPPVGESVFDKQYA